MGSVFKKIIVVMVFLGAVAGAGYYFQAKAKEQPQGGNAGGQQAMPVTVTIIEEEPVQIWKDFSARLEPVDYAEIRPQVSGVIKEVKFEDGAIVHKGDVLYLIDPRPYQAVVNQAQADLNAAYNEADLAQKELDRAKNLVDVDAISKRIYDERANSLHVSQAKAASAKARLEQAKINLDYASVKAPITGQVSRAEVKVGNLVEAGPNAPLLTSIVSTEGIYADFEIDEQTYLNEVRGHALSEEDSAKIPVKLKLSYGDNVYDGHIHSFDNRIDSTSGTIRARALFPNKDQSLLPGMYATIEMGSASPMKHILLTEKAIGTDQSRKFVFVVTDENKVAYRPVEIGDSTNGKRIILSGLKPGEKVITEGIIRIRPDMPVDPKTAEEMTQSQAPTQTETKAE